MVIRRMEVSPPPLLVTVIGTVKVFADVPITKPAGE
jgi:hypothetical protein